VKRIDFKAMGSRTLALLDADSEEAEKSLGSVPAWFEEWEQALSRFRPGNELDRLNRSNGLPMAISETLWEVFKAALGAEKFTGGLVTPTILDALVLAGYDRSFDSLSAIQSGVGYALKNYPLDRYAQPGNPGPCGVIVWDEPTRSLVMTEASHLDLGGVAKGWAADQAMQRLSHFGPALVNAGGDIAISGATSDGQPWPIGIDDPFQDGAHFETLKLEGCGVATSGKDYHRWLKDGLWHHHIIDPRSGLPADTDVMAATVVAPTVMEAEAAAKAAMIMGSEAGLEWLEADSGLAGILVLENGTHLYSRNMENFLWSN
jgi:thiamine biosynthesis lipoprotein